MAGYNIHEITVSDPEHGLHGEEFRPGFGVEDFLVLVVAEAGEPCAGLLVAEETPEGSALIGGYGPAIPCCVCARLVVSSCLVRARR